MSTLLVDVGNTRVKWAMLRNGAPARAHAMVHDGDPRSMVTLMRRVPASVDRIVAVSVMGARFELALASAARRRLKVRPEFMVSTRQACGVTNGYRDVWRLGVDRWVGVIGAYHLVRRAALVANVGTALTIDLVTGDGAHLGGAIVPGPATMVESLLAGTHGIRRRASGQKASEKTLFARDTASALAAGARYAAAAFIDRALAEAAKTLGTKPLLVLTGGGARDLDRVLRAKARVVPDLVLRGLAACAADR